MKKTTRNALKTMLMTTLLLLTSTVSFGQVPGVVKCYTDEMDALMHADHPSAETKADFESWIQEAIETAKANKVVGGVYQIPVVVHVIHSGEAIGSGTNVSQAAIQSQIDVLNEDYRRIFGSNGYNTNPLGADTKIEFCLAQRRPDGSAFVTGQPGVNRILYSTITATAPPYSTTFIDATIKPWTYNGGTATATRGWVPTKYMNIWLCNISGGILGYAQFPTSPLGGLSNCASGGSDATDGVVFLYNSIGKSSVTGFTGAYNEGRTATHEIGHWLGLRHIWGDGDCTVDDYCDDTPEAAAANFGCPTINSCTNAPDPGNDMVANYMDYTDDLCMNIFTNDQKQRMRAVLEGSPNRVSLINSDACTPPNPSDASITDVFNPKGDNCPGSIIPSVQLRNRGATTLTSATISYTIDNGAATNFSWTGSLAAGASLTVALPAFTASVLGTHTFKSWNTLPNGVADPSTTYDTSSISYVVSNGYMPNFSENFEAETFPPNLQWVVENVNGDCRQWTVGSGTSAAGVFINNAAMLPCFGNASTTNENLYTPIFILPCNATAATLTFNVAYRQKSGTTNDRLILEISQDCGATWTATTYDKQGSVLAVSSTLTGNTEYYPTSAAEWRLETVNLLSYVTSTSKQVRFRFRGIANNGNNVFVDDVKLNATTPGEIQLLQATAEVLDGGYYTFPNTQVGSSTTQTFTINNTGTTNLTLTPPITVTGTGFSLGTTFGATTIPAGGSTTFTLTFTPSAAGSYTGNVTFTTNDCDEGTYNFVLNGLGTVTPPVADFSGTPTTICQGGTVVFTNLSTGATSYSWSFGAGATPSTSTAVSPSVVFNTAGVYPITLTATNAYGNDVETKTGYITVVSSTGTALPLTEGFTTATFPPTGWSLINANASATTWVRTTTAGNAPTTGNSMMFDNYNFNDADDDQVRVKPLIFTGYTAAQMTFDVAYRVDSNNPSSLDGLEVLVTTDCGGTYTSVYSKSGATLATATTAAGVFTPSGATQWRTETVNLTPFVGQSNVIVVFKNLSAYGNKLYVDNVNITGTTTPTANYTATPNPACVGQTVTYTSTSTAATSYSWNFGAGATPATATTVGPHTVTYSSAGTKTVTLQINGTGPTSSQSVVVNANPTTPTITPSGATTFCSGGSVTLSAPASTSYLWSTGATTQTISVTTSGSYTVQVFNASGCSATSAATVVTVNPTPAAPTITAGGSTTFCSGGSVVLTSSAGTGNTWSTGATTPSITVTTAGTYTVTATATGCTSPASAGTTVTVNTTPAVPTITAGGPTTFCAGGSVVLTSSAGTGNTWSTGATTPSITVTTAGTYTVTATNGTCTSASSAGTTVTVNALPAAPTITAGGPTTFCAGGSVVLTSSAGTGNTWSTGATTASITVTTSGTYTVTRTTGGCTSPASAGTTVTVNPIPATPTITAGGSTTFCSGGSVVLTSSAGSGNTWSTGATTPSITVSASGTYTVTAAASGCTSASSAGTTVTVNPTPATPTITAGGSTTFCSGGSVVLTSSAGSGNTWSTGATTPSITVSAAGTYTVTATTGSCTSPASAGTIVTVNPTPAAPTITAGGSTTFCSGGSVVLTSSAGSGNTWSTGATTPSITVSASGTYTVTTAASGCTSASSAGTTVTVNPTPATPTITAGGPTTFCSGGSVVLTSSAGSGNTWSTGATTPSITVSTAGTYTVTATTGSCTSPASAGTTVTVNPTPAAPTITAGGSTTFCSGGSVVLTSSAGSGNTWSTGATTPSITVSAAGTYTVTATTGSCTSPSSAGTTVTVNPTPAAPTITAGGPTTFCSGGSVVLTSSAGSGNTWSTGATTPSITVSTAGTYTVTATTGSCTSPASAGTTVTVNPTPAAPTITAGGSTTFCSGGSVVLTSSAGSGNTWSTGATTPSITVSASGTYTVTATTGSCTSPASAGTTVIVNPTPTIAFGTITNPTTCAGTDGSLQITGSGSGNLTWSGASTGSMNGISLPQTIPSLSAGTYTINFASAAGCSSNTLNQSLVGPSAPSAPTITAGGPTAFCPGGSVTLTSSAGTTYLWSTGATTPSIVVSAAGSVTVQITNASGCVSPMSSATAVIINSVPSTPVITPGGPTTFCAGQNVTLTSSGSNSNWSSGENTNSIVVSTAGSYTVTETNGSGCTATSSPVSITVNAIPSTPAITAGSSTTFCAGGSVNLTSSSSTGNTWSTAETTPAISVSTSGTVTLTVTANGCTSAAASQAITVNNNPVVSMNTLNGVCTYTPAFALTGGSPAGGTYTGNGVSSGNFNPGVAGLGTSTITYSFTDGNGCTGSATTPIVVDGCVGLDENSISIALYPNPTNGLLHIESTESIENVVVYDKLGKLVFQQTALNKESVEIDLSAVATGIYTIHVTSAGRTTIDNIVIQK